MNLVRILSIALSAASVHAASTSGSSAGDSWLSSLKAPKGSTASKDKYHFEVVHSIQARVQSDEPVWNKEGKQFVSQYGDGLDDGHLQAMDNVNTASVEGSLMYVQAEGINYNTRSSEEKCTRKNEMTWVVFYEMAIVQTNETIALYKDDWDQPEYGPMVAMDGGRCTPDKEGSTSASTEYPEVCSYFNGDNGQPDIGPFIGGTSKKTDARAPYPNNVWFSFPNSCVMVGWDLESEDDSCRKTDRQGLCDVGVKPDGVECTFNYRILGYVAIDDLVGITSMTSNKTNENYANFSEFCEDGGVEFKATAAGEWEESIDFWLKPQDEDANVERFNKLIAAYKNLTDGSFSSAQMTEGNQDHFVALPSLDELRSSNPACYNNVPDCADATNGCMRDLYGMICQTCNSTSDACETAPSGFKFPELDKATGSNGETGDPNATGTGSTSSTGTSSATTDGSGAASIKFSLAAGLLALVALFN